ncbi:MAG: lysophospholipid acyltransferase family protein, partial [Aeromicrobium erythreum]
LFISHFMVDNGVTPRFLAKDTLFDVKGIGRILTGAEQIPVYRGSAGAAESLRAAEQAVLDGKVVTIYPEGTITRDPAAWPMSGRTGAVRVALATGRPLVPMAQWGSQEILWPYTKLPRIFPRKTIRVRIGEPIDLSDLADRPLTEAVLHEATERLMDTLTDMLAEIRGERPTGPRIDVHTLKHRTHYQEG